VLAWLSIWSKVQMICIWVQLMPVAPHHLLLHQNLDWFYLSDASLSRLSRKRGHYTGVLPSFLRYFRLAGHPKGTFRITEGCLCRLDGFNVAQQTVSERNPEHWCQPEKVTRWTSLFSGPSADSGVRAVMPFKVGCWMPVPSLIGATVTWWWSLPRDCFSSRWNVHELSVVSRSAFGQHSFSA